ncbi:hypothetical protein [Pelotomaculum propionicicum]|uniref:Uncharacterized protein n=1 Tax=Pelotomaculum propionicicum TaxID=258475 RepID=A0A4Y7RPN1_9FIRM|nr:hypothetical protein [Pelotomaculum propionicicum]TEB10659.1 hypothetical protein Pmgp_02239 [Pelotomaculum propionicicum]
MNPQEWKEVEKSLENFWSPVSLKCDGYEVTFVLRRISQMKNGIVVFVNGVFELRWLLEDCEERRRFLCPMEIYVYSKKQREGLKKFSKKLRKSVGLPDPDTKHTYYRFYWTSFISLKKHLIKNNKSIELVRGGQDDGSQKEQAVHGG